MPKPQPTQLTKSRLLQEVEQVCKDKSATARVLDMESKLRERIDKHLGSLPTSGAKFQKFFTSPFVLLIHSRQNEYQRISQIEGDILPSKKFMSMETSAGRLIEDVTLPAYGWESVPSAMHTAGSSLDGRKIKGTTLDVATLKSGPRCLNDEMSENFADNILSYGPTWAQAVGAKTLNFQYGVLYGTKQISNKKDWHILRKLYEKASDRSDISFQETPEGRWSCRFTWGKGADRLAVTANIRIGLDWWTYLGGTTCFAELCIVLIRACVAPGNMDGPKHRYEETGRTGRGGVFHPGVSRQLLPCRYASGQYFCRYHGSPKPQIYRY